MLSHSVSLGWPLSIFLRLYFLVFCQREQRPPSLLNHVVDYKYLTKQCIDFVFRISDLNRIKSEGVLYEEEYTDMLKVQFRANLHQLYLLVHLSDPDIERKERVRT